MHICLYWKEAFNFENDELGRRDAAGIFETDEFKLVALSDANFLIVEVPMNIN